jgi:hypothetical protein
MNETKATAPSKLFIIGLPRSGCTSLAAAISLKLNRSICSQKQAEQMGLLSQVGWMTNWIEAANARNAARKDAVNRALHRALGKCDVAAGIPLFNFVEDLMRVFPSAKFIICRRSNQAVWLDSMKSTWLPLAKSHPSIGVGARAYRTLHPMGIFSDAYHRLSWVRDFADEWTDSELIHAADKWTKGVIEQIPASRLSWINIEEGWGVLSPELKLPPEDDELLPVFPALATRGEFMSDLDDLSTKGLLIGSIYLVMPLVLYFILRRLRLI